MLNHESQPTSVEKQDAQTRDAFKAALQRRKGEPVLLPNTVHTHIRVGEFGCSVCAFSHNGERLALAAELAGRRFAIMVRVYRFILFELRYWIGDDDVSFYNSTASTWTLATPRTTWESSRSPQ